MIERVNRAIKIVALSLLVASALCGSYSVTAVTQNEPPNKLDSEQLERARTLFNTKCARCHGADGRGQTVLGEMLEVPDFTDSKWWKEHAKDKDLAETISNGKGDMPDFGKKLTKPEIALLADYVRLFKKTEP